MVISVSRRANGAMTARPPVKAELEATPTRTVEQATERRDTRSHDDRHTPWSGERNTQVGTHLSRRIWARRSSPASNTGPVRARLAEFVVMPLLIEPPLTDRVIEPFTSCEGGSQPSTSASA